jgi:transposase
MDVESFVEEWVKAYRAGETMSDLSERLGRKRATVYQRYYALRRAGLALPALSRCERESLVERARSALKKAMCQAKKIR